MDLGSGKGGQGGPYSLGLLMDLGASSVNFLGAETRGLGLNREMLGSPGLVVLPGLRVTSPELSKGPPCLQLLPPGSSPHLSVGSGAVQLSPPPVRHSTTPGLLLQKKTPRPAESVQTQWLGQDLP